MLTYFRRLDRGNEDGGTTVGDRTEGGVSRANTINESNNTGPADSERLEKSWEQLGRIAEFDAAARVNSMGSSNDDKDPRRPPGSPNKVQFHTKDDAFISDFYVFMPYLHFETVSKQKDMSDYYNHFADIKALQDDSRPTDRDRLKGRSNERDVALLRAYLNTPDHSLHIRRTLDQSFYHHINTEMRDNDQVIHRFQKEILEHGDETSKILMVDQLWMWVIGEKMVVTAFPPRWDQPNKDPLNLLDYVLSIIELG